MSILDEFSVLSFAIGVVCIVLLYWYSVRNHGYWKERGVPFIKPYPFIGTIGAIFSKAAQEIETERYYKYGRIYGHFEGNTPILSVGDPELLRNILVKDVHIFQGSRLPTSTGNKLMDNMLSLVKGEKWKRIRTIVSPTFSTGKIKKMISILNECSEDLMKNLNASVAKNEPIDAKNVFGAFTLDVIASSAFSTKLNSLQEPNNKFVAMAKELFPSGFNWRLAGFVLFPRIMKLLGETFFSSKSMSFFSELTHQIIDERKRTGQTRNDFLQLLLDTSKEFEEGNMQQTPEDTDDMTSNYDHKECNQTLHRNIITKSLSADELVSQCVVFFLAGFESTSTTLSLVAYLMAIYPDIQEKVRVEVDNALKDTHGEVTYEVVQKMKYLDNVISETLRLYPPAFRTERMASADYKLGEAGIMIEKGIIVTIPICGIHRDPEYFPEPDKFNPDRFSSRSGRDPFTFIPFGAGLRNCVAMRFALLELKVCLVHFIRTFEVKTCAETKIPVEFRFGQPLLQPIGIILQLKLRNQTT